jgi:hypothetical protein
MKDNLAESAIFFLGFFCGKSASQSYGLYGEDYEEIVNAAANATGYTPSWLKEKRAKEESEKAASFNVAVECTALPTEVEDDEIPF